MPEATVVIVDDDRTMLRLCQRSLERASFRVITTLDPLDAIHVLEHERADLLLSDIRMPVMDGFALIARAKELQPGLPVLVMTGFGSVDTAIQALHRGVDGLILKPFEDPSDLVEAVQRTLDQTRQKRDATRLQVLRPLFGVSETLLAETSPRQVEKLSLQAMIDLFQACCVGIYDVCGSEEDAPYDRIAEYGIAQQEAAGVYQVLLGLVFAEETPALYLTNGPGNEQIKDLLRQLGYGCALVSVVRRNKGHFAFFAARSHRGQVFTEADMDMFAILARQSTVAMENARLYSDLRNYVQQVETSQRALIQAEKMAVVGRLMGSLAHEINNPLQAVRNCLHLAARRDVSDDERLNYLDLTDSELERLVSTVRSLLDVSRAGKVEEEGLQITTIIERVQGLLEPQLRAKNIQLEVTYTGEPLALPGVPDQLQQVFFNLLLNSMDSMEDQTEEKRIWLDVFFDTDRIHFMLEDSGPALPGEMRERMFEPFASTKTNGTGFGLAVSYGIIQAHHGTMEVNMPRRAGRACIEVTLPGCQGG